MKSDGRIEQEKAIMNKIQSIFDNAEFIKEFEINISGGVGEATEIKYKVIEAIVPKGDIK